jgi:hypothetical protein
MSTKTKVKFSECGPALQRQMLASDVRKLADNADELLTLMEEHGVGTPRAFECMEKAYASLHIAALALTRPGPKEKV